MDDVGGGKDSQVHQEGKKKINDWEWGSVNVVGKTGTNGSSEEKGTLLETTQTNPRAVNYEVARRHEGGENRRLASIKGYWKLKIKLGHTKRAWTETPGPSQRPELEKNYQVGREYMKPEEYFELKPLHGKQRQPRVQTEES